LTCSPLLERRFRLSNSGLEIGDHCLKLGNLPPMLANMKILQVKDVDTPASMVRNVKILQAKKLCM
jgi:Tfp pilus assembly PilM family ATPase